MKRHGWRVPEHETPPHTTDVKKKTASPCGGAAVSAKLSAENPQSRAQSARRTRQRCDGVRTSSKARAAVPEKTMFFLDWDDTLLPTTHLRSTRSITPSGTLVGVPPPSLRVQLLALEREVCDLLARVQGQPNTVVCIVTSASAGWVESSAAQFMPTVAAAIKSRQVRVRNARASSQGTNADATDSGNSALNPARWKADVFWEELAQLRWSSPAAPSSPSAPLHRDVDIEPPHCEPQSVRIVSIGDSHWERTAASVVGRQGDVVVTVKLAANPSCAALRQQLRRIRQAVDQLCSANRSAAINAVAQRDGKMPAKPASVAQARSGSGAIAT